MEYLDHLRRSGRLDFKAATGQGPRSPITPTAIKRR